MNLLWGILITVGATAIAVAAMLLVRRNASGGEPIRRRRPRGRGVRRPRDGLLEVLGFIVFLAFTSYDQSRSGAETEALMILQQVETAQFFPPEAAAELTGELTCYGRSVVNEE